MKPTEHPNDGFLEGGHGIMAEARSPMLRATPTILNRAASICCPPVRGSDQEFRVWQEGRGRCRGQRYSLADTTILSAKKRPPRKSDPVIVKESIVPKGTPLSVR